MPPIQDVPAPNLIDLLSAFTSRNWYAIAAISLMLLIQVAKTNEVSLWTKTPVGARFLWPVGIAAVTAFVHAFALGKPFAQAGLDVLNSLWQIALPAMGFSAALRESPLPWSGGAGGFKLSPRTADPLPSPLAPDDRPTPIDHPPFPPSEPPAAA